MDFGLISLAFALGIVAGIILNKMMYSTPKTNEFEPEMDPWDYELGSRPWDIQIKRP